ncbi:MAG: hypothetical protein E6G57_09460 [Actinobacteria bacterium]|nr:MAG: hypothetical protein E6G57_09460 [Actinomycetota bacterium]
MGRRRGRGLPGDRRLRPVGVRRPDSKGRIRLASRPVNRVLSFAVAVAVGGVLLVGCSGNHKTENFRINATSVNGQSGFSVGTITVTQGDKVNIDVGNTTDKAHGFSIDAFNIHHVVEPHQTQKLSFTQLHPAHVPAQMIVVG